VFISWTDVERRQMALEVAAGRLDYRIARALLDGWVEDDGSDRKLVPKYAEVCSLLSIPDIEFVCYDSPDGSVERYLVNFVMPDDQVLSETGVQHLEQTSNEFGGSVMQLKPDIGQFTFPSEEQARSFLRELLRVLSSSVFRKAG